VRGVGILVFTSVLTAARSAATKGFSPRPSPPSPAPAGEGHRRGGSCSCGWRESHLARVAIFDGSATPPGWDDFWGDGPGVRFAFPPAHFWEPAGLGLWCEGGEEISFDDRPHPGPLRRNKGFCPTALTRPAATLSRSRGRGTQERGKLVLRLVTGGHGWLAGRLRAMNYQP